MAKLRTIVCMLSLPGLLLSCNPLLGGETERKPPAGSGVKQGIKPKQDKGGAAWGDPHTDKSHPREAKEPGSGKAKRVEKAKAARQ